MLVEGQGEFRQPPSDNYNLPLDPYRAASSFVMVCTYVDGPFSFEFTWTKDGANFQHSIQSIGRGVQATVPVPNGEYLSSLEETYTCRVSLGGFSRGSRNIIVTLSGEPRPVCTSPTSHMHSHVRVVSCTMSHLLYTTFRECYCHVKSCILTICWLYRIFRKTLFCIVCSYCT